MATLIDPTAIAVLTLGSSSLLLSVPSPVVQRSIGWSVGLWPFTGFVVAGIGLWLHFTTRSSRPIFLTWMRRVGVGLCFAGLGSTLAWIFWIAWIWITGPFPFMT